VKKVSIFQTQLLSLMKHKKQKTKKQIFSSDEEKSTKAKELFTSQVKGYISRITTSSGSQETSTNNLPKRVDIGLPITEKLDNSRVYERNEETSENSVTVVYSKLQGLQLQEYLKSFMLEFNTNEDTDPNEMWNTSRSICRGIKTKHDILSQKFEDIWHFSRQFVGKGVFLNYSFYIDEGIMMFERFLLSKKETALFNPSEHQVEIITEQRGNESQSPKGRPKGRPKGSGRGKGRPPGSKKK